MKDFTWWSSLTIADAKRGIEVAGDAIESRSIEGRTFWSGPAMAGAGTPHRAHLLQGYDDYVIAYSESRDVLDVDGDAGVVPGRAAMFTHAVLLDGQVVGHWRRRALAGAVAVDVQLGRSIDAASTQAIDDAVRRYGEFVGLPIEWSAEPG